MSSNKIIIWNSEQIIAIDFPFPFWYNQKNEAELFDGNKAHVTESFVKFFVYLQNSAMYVIVEQNKWEIAEGRDLTVYVSPFNLSAKMPSYIMKGSVRENHFLIETLKRIDEHDKKRLFFAKAFRLDFQKGIVSEKNREASYSHYLMLFKQALNEKGQALIKEESGIDSSLNSLEIMVRFVDTLKMTHTFLKLEGEYLAQDLNTMGAIPYTEKRPTAIASNVLRVQVDFSQFGKALHLKQQLAFQGTRPILAEVRNVLPEENILVVTIIGKFSYDALPENGTFQPMLQAMVQKMREDALLSLLDGSSPNRFLARLIGGFHVKAMPTTFAPYQHTKLTPKQLLAVQKGIACQDLLLVTDVSGTQKAAVMSAWVKYFAENLKQRVLLCAKTDGAVDRVLDRVMRIEGVTEVMRIGQAHRVQDSVRPYLMSNQLKVYQRKIVKNFEVKKDTMENTVAFLNLLKQFLERMLIYQERGPKIAALYASFIANIVEKELPTLHAHHRRHEEILLKFQEVAYKLQAMEAKLKEEKSIDKKGIKRLFNFVNHSMQQQSATKYQALYEQAQVLKSQEHEVVEAYQQAMDALMENHLCTDKNIDGLSQYVWMKHEEAQLISMSDKVNTLRRKSLALFSCIALPQAYSQKQYEEVLALVNKELPRFAQVERIRNAWGEQMKQDGAQNFVKSIKQSIRVVGLTMDEFSMNTWADDLDFDVVIIDDAGEFRLHELLAPLAKGKKAILVSDGKAKPSDIDQPILEKWRAADLEHDTLPPHIALSFFDYLMNGKICTQRTLGGEDEYTIEHCELLLPESNKVQLGEV
ncbi:MAG: hypothetical protein H7Y41_06705 [Hyphomonadaceae bacterium]|nr:hypothetical protein [Clostridia bacterium]